MLKRIDFDHPLPYYSQLITLLSERIHNGEWQPGDQLPSEADLCQMYAVSRTVVRQALQEMQYAGLVSRRKGKGTFVAQPKLGESLVQTLTGFYQDMRERGHTVATQVLQSDRIQPSPKIAEQLQLEAGADVYRIERLRFVDGEPIVLVTTYLPCRLCPGLAQFDLSARSLYEVLEHALGLELSHGRRSIEAVAANAREAQLLDVREGDPLIRLESVTFLKDGRPVEYYQAVHRGDRSRFEVELYRR